VRNGRALALRDVPLLGSHAFREWLVDGVRGRNGRVVSYFGVPEPEGVALVAVLADDANGRLFVARSACDGTAFVSVVPEIAQEPNYAAALVALALAGLGRFSPFVQHLGGRSHLTILLPGIGLFLTTIWLSLTGIGEVSLFKDMDLARKNPYQVFPFWVSLGKVVACALTIGFGGSAGRAAARGADIETHVELSLAEVAAGVAKEVNVRRRVACKDCGGSGAAAGPGRERCQQCGGRGTHDGLPCGGAAGRHGADPVRADSLRPGGGI